MKNYVLLLFLVLFASNRFFAQNELLWMDRPMTVETPTNIFDNKSKIKKDKVIIPKYDLKIYRKDGSQKFYFKKKLFFDSSAFFEESVSFFSELYNENYIILLFKPSKDAVFHNPISVKRERMLIIDYKNNSEYLYEVNLDSRLLLPSEKVLNEVINHNTKNNVVIKNRIGIIKNIDLSNEIMIVLDYNKNLIEFDLVKVKE